MQYVNHIPNNQTMLPMPTPIKLPMYVSLKFVISRSNTLLCIKNLRVTVKCLIKLFNNCLGDQEFMILSHALNQGYNTIFFDMK